MFLLRFTGLFLITVLFSISVYPQKKGLEQWLSLKVFKNKREDVEKIFGKGEIDRNKYFVTYKHSNGIVSVQYAWGGNCQNSYDDWNVPEWTVIEVSYIFWNNEPELNDLIGNDKRFKKTTYGDVLGQVKYVDESRGISLYSEEGKTTVEEITIFPTSDDDKLYGCRKIDRSSNAFFNLP